MYYSIFLSLQIDSSTVLLIEDTSLEKYLPALGDRVALRSYCDNHAEKTSSDSKIVPSRKNVLLEKLRKKMKLKPSLTATEDSSDDDKHSQCNDRKLGNKHAAKSTRKIEFGWIHNGKQVRARGGGGTRRISVSKNIDCDGLLKIGKDLFFPDGQSKKGNENQFTFEIWDFKENVLPLDMTVGAAYEKVKMGIVHFYLASLDRGAFETVVQVEDKVPEVTVCCEKSGLAQFCVPPKVSLHSESEQDTAAHLLKNFPSSPLKETSEFDCCTLTEGELGHGASRNILQSSAFLSAMHSSDSEIEFGPLNYEIETCDDTLPWEVHFISNLNQQVVSSNKPMPQGAITFVSSISEKSAAMLPSCSTQTPKGDITILPSLLFPLPAPDCSTVQLPPQHNLAPSSSPLQQVLQLPPPMPGSLTLQLSPDHSLSPSSPPIQQLANSPQPAQLSPTQQNADVRILTLRRVIILQDMLGEFKDSNILNASLTIEFVDEAGSDVSGISRDAYSAFWEAFFQNCAEGEYERVPALYPEYGKEEWEAVGRILLKGYLDQSYFPIQLSLAFAVGLVYGESEITPGILMASFLRYIAPFEKDIITSALDGSIGADDQDELLDILSRMGCHTVPSHDSMKCTILQVAHKQLIQEPKYALEVMADVTRSTLQKLLPEVSNLEALYEAKKPTVKQVLNMINAEVQNAAQNKTMNFLKQFIRSLDDGRLQKFLRFVTGADMLCVEKIDIQFTDIRGLQRRPVAHTCGPLLEVPCTYNTYTEFRSEFQNIVDGDCHRMDII